MTSETQRADPFADLSDFQPRATKKSELQRETVRRVSEENNFPSRSPEKPKATAKPAPVVSPQRRRRTGRNVQFNIKATQETVNRFTALADDRGLVFGALLEQALDAFEKLSKPK